MGGNRGLGLGNMGLSNRGLGNKGFGEMGLRGRVVMAGRGKNGQKSAALAILRQTCRSGHFRYSFASASNGPHAATMAHTFYPVKKKLSLLFLGCFNWAGNVFCGVLIG